MERHPDWQMPEARSPRIGVLTGYWSTNIGNAFFQLGAQYALEQALPGAHIFLIGDQPGYWNVAQGNPANALDYVKPLDLDAAVAAIRDAQRPAIVVGHGARFSMPAVVALA